MRSQEVDLEALACKLSAEKEEAQRDRLVRVPLPTYCPACPHCVDDTRALWGAVRRLTGHIGLIGLTEFLARVAARYDELDRSDGTAVMEVMLKVHRGKHAGGEFDPNFRF